MLLFGRHFGGVAALAGAETGFGGVLGCIEEGHVLAQGEFGGAGRTAEDLSGGDCVNELAVGGGVALLEGEPAPGLGGKAFSGRGCSRRPVCVHTVSIWGVGGWRTPVVAFEFSRITGV